MPFTELHLVLPEPMSIDDFFRKYKFGEILKDVPYWQGATIAFWYIRKHAWWPGLKFKEVIKVEPRDIKYSDLSYVHSKIEARVRSCVRVSNFLYKISRFVISF